MVLGGVVLCCRHAEAGPRTAPGWAHVVCALYIPEVQFANVLTMEPIVLQYVPHDRFNKVSGPALAPPFPGWQAWVPPVCPLSWGTQETDGYLPLNCPARRQMCACGLLLCEPPQ